MGVMAGLPRDIGLRGLLMPLGQRPAEVLLLGPPDDIFTAACRAEAKGMACHVLVLRAGIMRVGDC